MEADGLSRLRMQDAIPDLFLQEVYAINELERETNKDFLLDMTKIREEQDQNQKLQDLVRCKNKTISLITLGGTEVYTIKGKVWVPTQLQARIIEWYRSNLHHPGVTCTLNSLSQTFKWKGMCREVENHIKTCDACQRHKIIGKGHYGQMPLVSSTRDKDTFKKVYVDCARQWTIHVKTVVRQELVDYKLHILTMVDVATNWPELMLIPSANSCSCTKMFDHCWLCCYPLPNTVGHDNGNKIMWEEF